MYKLLPILLFAYGLAVTTDDIYDNSYALIIGIDKYENVRPLNYAVKDAESIQDILVNTFNFPEGNITLLKNEEATKQSIIQAFSDITTKAEDKDRVLIYFAGHGDTDDLPEGGEMGYLLPVDGDNENLFVTSIAMDDLKRISLMSKAKHLLYLVDACYGGLLTIGSRGLDSKTTSNYIDKITKNKSRQIITAGGRGEQVIEKSEWGHSAFTLNLNRGLKDGNADMDADGYITANELGLFLKKKVTIDSENQQTPQYGRMTSQEGEFVFVYSENPAIIQDESTDAKLDLVLSELAELKSQKSIDEDVVLKETVDGNKSWYEKYGYGGHGIGFTLFDDLYSVNFQVLIDKKWSYGFIFTHAGNKSIKRLITIPEFHTVTSNALGIGFGPKYYINDRINIDIGCGVGYNLINWENTAQNTSGKFNVILPSLNSGVSLDIHQSPTHHPFPMRVLFYFGITCVYPPTTFEIDTDGIEKLDDWQIIFEPQIAFALQIPK